MDTKYNTLIKIRLVPEGSVAPIIRAGIYPDLVTMTLTESTVLDYNVDLAVGEHRFVLEFTNKTNDTPDMAVIIESVTVEGITVDRFKWAGVYTPIYPEPWASTQTNLKPKLPAATYLGWNGQWELPFTVPIFTWMHQVEHLGWIYS